MTGDANTYVVFQVVLRVQIHSFKVTLRTVSFSYVLHAIRVQSVQEWREKKETALLFITHLKLLNVVPALYLQLTLPAFLLLAFRPHILPRFREDLLLIPMFP